jgi:hypothetical protein
MNSRGGNPEVSSWCRFVATFGSPPESDDGEAEGRRLTL